MISFQEAFRLVITNTPVLAGESVVLDDLVGRVLAEPIFSPLNLPIFTNSAVDGFAVRSADTQNPPASLKLVGTIPAGSSNLLSLSPHEAARVFTGSPLPEGCDAVVMQEDTHSDGSQVVVSCAVKPGACVRVEGEEVKSGDLVLNASTRAEPRLITPSVLGVIASLGITSACVYKRPRVTVLGTGSELISPGGDLGPGQIYESNSLAVAAAVRLAGGLVEKSQTVRDDRDAIVNTLREAMTTSDVIITCGGVSVGDHDLVRECAKGIGVKEVFWRVNVRPGKPIFFGLGPEGQMMFGLPGNPVSALLGYWLYVRPCLKGMVGLYWNDPTVYATLHGAFDKQVGRFEVVRARARKHMNVEHPKLMLEPTEGQGSHMLTGLANADHVIWLDEQTGPLPHGALIKASRIVWELDNVAPHH